MYVSYKLQKITVSIYKNRLVPSPKQLTVTLVQSIETLRIDTVYVAHATNQMASRYSPLASDPDAANAQAVLPRLTALERRYGSITMGMLVNRLLKRRRAKIMLRPSLFAMVCQNSSGP